MIKQEGEGAAQATLLHLPVLLNEILEAFKSQEHQPQRILDGTFGRGGHTAELLKQMPQVQIVAFDKDPEAIACATQSFGLKFGDRFKIVHDDFKNFFSYNLGQFDGVLLDLGISSPQVDQAERGFSFMNDGPLDMRMNNKTQELNAAEIINGWSEKELSDLFYHGGEVKHPNRVVRAIVHDRKSKTFTTTRELASLIERVDGFRGKGHHPATNYFLALRMAVNGELEGLAEFLTEAPKFLNQGARICVITFHSLEDRIVKNAFKEMHKKSGLIVNKKVIVGSDEEISQNKRSRSAKLRIFQIGVENE